MIVNILIVDIAGRYFFWTKYFLKIIFGKEVCIGCREYFCGWIQNEIAKSAYDYQLKIDSGEKIIVGVNKYEEDEESELNLQEISQTLVSNQINRVKEFKQNRDNNYVTKNWKSFSWQK